MEALATTVTLKSEHNIQLPNDSVLCILCKGALLIFIKRKYFIKQKKIKSVHKAQMASIFTRGPDGNIICDKNP